MALIAAVAGLVGCSGAGAAKAAAGGPSLDPSRYRAQIVTIDRIVYDTTVITEVDRDTLADQFESLARRVSSDDASPATRLVSQNLQHLAKEVHDRPLAQVRAGDTLEVEWEITRGKSFRDAAWWRHNVDDPVASTEPDRPHPAGHSPGLDLEATQIEVAVRELESLADDGDQLGTSASTDASSSSDQKASQAAVRDWQVRIEREAQQLQSTPPNRGDPHLDSAYHQTLAAVKSLRNGGSIADRASAQQWIEDARAHLKEARRQLGPAAG